MDFGYGQQTSEMYLKPRKMYNIVNGSEFGKKEGHIMIIHKALYGLRFSGLRWHKQLADYLRDMGFYPCKVEPDKWMIERLTI